MIHITNVPSTWPYVQMLPQQAKTTVSKPLIKLVTHARTMHPHRVLKETMRMLRLVSQNQLITGAFAQFNTKTTSQSQAIWSTMQNSLTYV